VGRFLDQKGWTFTQDKKDSVCNFPLPVFAGELKSFIGLTVFFHTHVPKMQEMCHTMNKMLGEYTKSKRKNRLQWSEKAIADFEEVSQASNP
jgi:hypothetical protein